MVEILAPARSASADQLLRLLTESVRDYALLGLDPAGNVVSWSAGAQAIKGYTAEEIVGCHFSRFFSKEDIAAGKPEQELAAATASGRVEEDGWRIRKDGSRFRANIVIAAARDEVGELIGYAKIVRDVSDR